jgi:hypothetical protein
MRILITTALLAVLAVWAQSRTFTNQKGNTFEATLISADALQAELMGGNGKRYKVAIRTLSEADQKFCRDWAAANPQIKLTVKAEGFRAKGSRDEKDGQGRSGDTSTSNRTQTAQEGYRITVSNWSSSPGAKVSGLTVEYAIVVGYTDTKAKDRRGVKHISRGSMSLPELTGSRPQTVETQTVTTRQSASVSSRTERDSDGDTRTATSAALYRESMDGVFLVIKHGKRVVASHSTGKVPQELVTEMTK